nr:Telomere recombination [uncultured bacterium]
MAYIRMTSIEHAVSLLKNGKLVAIPTETVYGLGADAKNPMAIQKIYAAKGRPATNPLIIHIPNIDAINDFAIEVPIEAFKLAKAFWPGPLTLILKRHPEVPLIVTAGQETIALRIPNHPLTLQLLEKFKGGIAAPSANRYGRISPTTAEHVQKELGEAVDYILDGGPCNIGIESTIVSLIDAEPIILRQGHISASALTSVLGKTVLVGQKYTRNIEVPGMSASHYAPEKPLYLLTKEQLLEKALELSKHSHSFSVLAFTEKPTIDNLLVTFWICAPRDPISYAKDFYLSLHRLDECEGECILVEPPPDSEQWAAIQERLARATFPRLAS